MAFKEDLLAKMRAPPGVDGAGEVDLLPLGGSRRRTGAEAPKKPLLKEPDKRLVGIVSIDVPMGVRLASGNVPDVDIRKEVRNGM